MLLDGQELELKPKFPKLAKLPKTAKLAKHFQEILCPFVSVTPLSPTLIRLRPSYV